MKRKWRVAIVGAGPGGLFTAYNLQGCANANYELSIFEATDRVGGKILTPFFDTAPVYYEAGAAEFYDYSRHATDDLKTLIKDLGLPISSMGGSAVIMDSRVIANLDDLGRHLGTKSRLAYQRFDRDSKDAISPQEFHFSEYPEGSPGVLCSTSIRERDSQVLRPEKIPGGSFRQVLDEIPDPQSVKYIEHMIHSDLATEPESTDVRYGIHNYVMNDPRYMTLYGIDGGNERLPTGLAERIDANWYLEHRVTRIGKADNRNHEDAVTDQKSHYFVETSGKGDSTPRRFEGFDFVVIALPHNALPSVSYSGDPLNEAMKQHYDYYHHPAHYLRISILFRSQFWKQELTDSFWMLDQLGGCCLYDESSRRVDLSRPGLPDFGVLGWLLGGQSALEMSAFSDEDLLAHALDSLPDFLAHGREQVIECRVHRWDSAVSAVPGGGLVQPMDRRHQPEPVEHPGLFVVGDYLFDTTLNGVLDSGNYVAAWIARMLQV